MQLCGKFQAFCMFCSHFITSLSIVRQDLFLHLSDIYKVVNLFGVYNNNFPMVFSEEYRPTYQGGVIYHNKNMRRNKKGCPTNTRIKTEMDTTEKIKRLCGICRLPSHTWKCCPNIAKSSI